MFETERGFEKSFERHSVEQKPELPVAETTELVDLLPPESSAYELARQQLDWEAFGFDPLLQKYIGAEIEKQIETTQQISDITPSSTLIETKDQSNFVSLQTTMTTSLPVESLLKAQAAELARLAVRGVRPQLRSTENEQVSEISYDGDYRSSEAVSSAIRDQEVLVVATWLYSKSDGDIAEFEAEAGTILRHMGTQLELQLPETAGLDRAASASRGKLTRSVTFKHEMKQTISHLVVEIEDVEADQANEANRFEKQTKVTRGRHDTALEMGDWQT